MPVSRDTILDTALRLADASSWEALRLHQVARALDIELNDIRLHFNEKEDLVDGWFDRADAAMLAQARATDFALLASQVRLARALMAWLDTLAPHRRVTREMVLNKLEPGHLHYQLDGALRVSRTVQWWREAAGRDATLPWRALEETALTGIYLTVFGYWTRDDSAGSSRTRELLERLLARAAQAAAWVPGARRGSAQTSGVRW